MLSADDNGEIALEQEIDIVIQYLSCMELRYQQNLQYSVQIPGALSCTNTKRATITGRKIQSSTHPPLCRPRTSKLSGGCLENSWAVSVINNGPGFAKRCWILL